MSLGKLSTFRFSWWVCALAIISCLTTTKLGFWQLDRAKEKESLIKQWKQKSTSPAVPLAKVPHVWSIDHQAHLDRSNPSGIHYTRIQWQGAPLNDHVFLLDNRMRGHKAGFEVLTPIRTHIGLVLLNRGWIEKKPSHYDLPIVKSLDKTQGKAHIYVPPKALTLGNSAPTDQWPKVIQSIDFAVLGQTLDEPLLPFTLRIENGDNTSLNTEWPSLRLNSDKNIGYAVQWFAISVALLVGFVATGLKGSPPKSIEK